MLQPALSIAVTWAWADAVELDEHDRLLDELSSALAHVFAVFGEQLRSAALA
jgi:hypothetical protein